MAAMLAIAMLRLGMFFNIGSADWLLGIAGGIIIGHIAAKADMSESE